MKIILNIYTKKLLYALGLTVLLTINTNALLVKKFKVISLIDEPDKTEITLKSTKTSGNTTQYTKWYFTSW